MAYTYTIKAEATGRDFNCCVLVGEVASRPVARVADNAGHTVASFVLHTYERGLRGQQRAERHKVTVWNKLATVAERLLYPGTRALIVGNLHENWSELRGVHFRETTVTAWNIITLDNNNQINICGHDYGERQEHL